MFLQITWLILVAVLLIGYAILDGFDLGIGLWHPFAKDNEERSIMLNSIRPFWDGNEVWLLTGGGAIFAAFPPVYATVFSGFYLALMLVLLGLILRAVSIDFRDKIDSVSWRKRWDIAFSVGSFLPALLFGVAVGNIVVGLPLDADGNYTGTFLALLNPYSLLCGVMGLFMFATHGAVYLTMKAPRPLSDKARGWALKSIIIFALFYLVVAVWGLFAYERGQFILPLILSVVAILFIGNTYLSLKKEKELLGFLSSCGSIIFIMAATGAHLFPYLVPSTSSLNQGLTIFNSSSSQLTLKVMFIIAIVGMPIVISYTFYLYRVFKGKASAESLYAD